MMRSFFALFGLLVASGAHAQTVPIGAGWQYFSWQNLVTPVTRVVDLSTATQPAELRLTDAFSAGDEFKVDITSNIGDRLTLYTSTAVRKQYGPQVWNDPDAAWKLEGYYSRVAVTLAPGRIYTLSILTIRSGQTSEGVVTPYGTGYIRVTLPSSPAILTLKGTTSPQALSSQSALPMRENGFSEDFARQ